MLPSYITSSLITLCYTAVLNGTSSLQNKNIPVITVCSLYVKLNDLWGPDRVWGLEQILHSFPSPDSRVHFCVRHPASPKHWTITELNLQQSDQTHLRGETRDEAPFNERKVFKDQPPSSEDQITRLLVPDLRLQEGQRARFPKTDLMPEPWEPLQPILYPKLGSKAKSQGWMCPGRISMWWKIRYIIVAQTAPHSSLGHLIQASCQKRCLI